MNDLTKTELAELRLFADGQPWARQYALRVLLDAYEDRIESATASVDELAELENKLDHAQEIAEVQHAVAAEVYEALLAAPTGEDIIELRASLNEAFRFEPCSICPPRASKLYEDNRCKAHGRPKPTKGATP